MKYPYLFDTDFLDAISAETQQVLYTKVTALNWNEDPIYALEGVATGGSITANGASQVQRAGSLSIAANEFNYKITDVNNVIAINKKIKLAVGYENHTTQYVEHPIIWIPLGTYIITNANVSHSVSGLNISLSLQDKMATLNGTCGGTFKIETKHHPIQVRIGEDIKEEEVLIFDLIREALIYQGGLSAEQIIIEDVPKIVRNAVRWSGNKPVYVTEINSIPPSYNLSYTKNDNADTYSAGDTLGYQYTTFTYPAKELTSKAGDTVATLINKIASAIGNYEFFFDVEGNFHFQEIKNFLNEGSAEDNLIAALNDKFLRNDSIGKSVYNLASSAIVSCSNAPQYSAIKNDITVLGKQENQSIIYHLLVDYTPTLHKTYTGVAFVTDKYGVVRAQTGGPNEICPKDWRSQIYFDYVINGNKSFPYCMEIEEWWPKVCDIREETLTLYTNDAVSLNSTPYFIHILDPNLVTNEDLRGFAITEIGAREKVIGNSDINCIMAPKFPNIVYIQAGQDNTAELRQEAILNRQAFAQVDDTFYKKLILGRLTKPAYDYVRSIFHEISSYRDSINLTVIPKYWLKPNTRISVNDEQSSVRGDYVISSITYPLAPSGSMNISASKAIERI